MIGLEELEIHLNVDAAIDFVQFDMLCVIRVPVGPIFCSVVSVIARRNDRIGTFEVLSR